MTKWEKVVVETGLLMMRPNVRRERVDALMDGDVLHGEKMAALIDECKASLLAFIAKHEDKKPDVDIDTTRAMLEKVDGATVVASSADDLEDWVIALRKLIANYPPAMENFSENLIREMEEM